jgi:hypothetical protein
MLAATHRLNALMHRLGATPFGQDVMHSYLLTVNEFERLEVAHAGAMRALRAIERLRPAYVRGDWPGGTDAAAEALRHLGEIRGTADTEAGSS